jgi:hypothetical protein
MAAPALPKVSFNLTTQGNVALVSYLLVLVAMFFPMNGAAEGEQAPKYNFGERFFAALMMLIPMALSVYTINCLVAGQCSVWSWINAVIILVWALLIFISAVFASFARK